MMSSFCIQFNNNCHRDAWLIALGNSLTSVYAGFIVFGTLGVLAEARMAMTANIIVIVHASVRRQSMRGGNL